MRRRVRLTVDQLTQVALDTEVRQHPRQDDLVDATLAELQDEVVGLGAPHFVGTDDDGLAVLNERLVEIEPVGPGARERVEAEWVGAKELFAFQRHFFRQHRRIATPGRGGRGSGAR